jgi:hypothetical protein
MRGSGSVGSGVKYTDMCTDVKWFLWTSWVVFLAEGFSRQGAKEWGRRSGGCRGEKRSTARGRRGRGGEFAGVYLRSGICPQMAQTDTDGVGGGILSRRRKGAKGWGVLEVRALLDLTRGMSSAGG